MSFGRCWVIWPVVRAAVVGLAMTALGLAGWASVASGRMMAYSPSSPAPPDGLIDVSCGSSSSCVATGYYYNSGQPGAMVWDGASWSPQPPLIPAGATRAQLVGVSCPSSTECVAVGSSVSQSAGLQPLVERWDGASWSVQPTPASPGSEAASLLSVSCPASDHCTAVGFYSGGSRVPLAERWNGTRWSVQALPAAHGQLRAVSCPGRRRCTALGAGGAWRWNGTRWSRQSRRVRGQDVSCFSRRQCMAVGAPSGHGLPVAWLWNGKRWSRQRVAPPAGDYKPPFNPLLGVSCSARKLCTAVGDYQCSEDAGCSLVERWQHGSWSDLDAPSAGSGLDEQLTRISCVSASFCAAIGSSLDGGYAILATWNGTSWSATTS